MDNGIMVDREESSSTFLSSASDRITDTSLRYIKMCKELSLFTYRKRSPPSRKSINKTNAAVVTRTTYTKPTTLDFRLYPKETLIENSNSTLVMENNSNSTKIFQNIEKRRWRFSRRFITSSSSSSISFMSASYSAIFYLILYIFLTTTDLCLAARQDAPMNCAFPQRWEGSWFLSGYQQSIQIKGSQFSYRGKCAASDGNKYLLVDERGCHRCLVIYEKHKNVLQYKESECDGDSMYMDQSNPAALPMRSLSKSDHRGAHPNTNNNNNGHSRLSSSDQYIMRSNDDMSSCSYCRGRETLQTLCDQIPGDALLYSLFRENAEPVKCPLKGPYSFTYNRGHGECKSPVSNIDSCTEDSRLLLSFQACPDVQGTESTDEELTCLATWKDGNSRYLVGLVSHHHAISNEDRYRCFVYERILPMMGAFPGGQGSGSLRDGEYKLAQSGDATCNGLDSAEVGSRIMTLRKPTPAERCDFPSWFKGPKHWHALMGNSVYNYHQNDGSMHIIKANGVMETRALCEQINKQTSTEMMAVVQHTTGCNSGFMCMMFYRRDTHVIEIQSGKPANRLEDACAPDYFDFNKTPFITLLANNPDPQICPLEGLYYLHGAIGPPYVTSRHKRNHNGKHNHHHRHGISSLSSSAIASAPLSSSRLRRDTESSSLPLIPSDVNGNGVIETSQLRQLNRNSNLKISEKDEVELNAVITGNGDIRRNRRDTSGCVVNTKARRHLWVGCTAANVIDVKPHCNDDSGDEEYSCHGSWMENGTTFVVARHKGTKHGVCITYQSTEMMNAKLIVGDTCYRGIFQAPDHLLVANLTHYGKCGDPSGSNYPHPTWIILLSATLTALVISQR